jgi:putative PEP-CTERM system TPR-repeat lipoprotein
MRLAPLALSVSLAFSTLSGCDSAASLTSEEHLQRARDRQEQGDVKGSVIELKNAVQKDPQNAQARWMLGQAYLRAKLPENAIKELEAAQRLGVGTSALQVDLAEALLLQRDFSAVLDRVQLDSQAPAAQRARAMQLRADALIGLGKVPEACALYGESSATDPKLAKAHIGLGTCAFLEDKPDAAEAQVRRAIELDPSNPDHKLMLANLARAGGNRDAAIAAYGEALKNEPANIDALSGRALALLAQNRAKDAEKDVRSLREAYPRHYMVNYLDAALAAHNQQYEKARDLLQNNLKAAPNHVESLFLLGAVNIQLGQLTLAEQNLNAVLRLIPGSIPARTLLASVHLKRSQPKAAYDVLLPVLRARPDFTQLGLAGEALLQMGRTTEANALFKEAAKLQPQSGAPSLSLGRASLQQGKVSDALDFLQQAATDAPTRLQAELFMVRTLWQQGERASALKRLGELEEAFAEEVDLALLRGSLLFQNNEVPSARAAFDKALAIEPNNTRAILALVDLDKRQGQTQQADARLANALKAKPNDEALLLASAIRAEERGRRDEAHGLMERAAKANPNALLPQQFLVHAALEAGQPQRALELARSYADRQQGSRDARMLLANTQFAAKDFDNAVAGYRRLLADSPNDGGLNLKLGLALLSLDRTGEARDALRKAIATSGEAFAPLHALASLEARTGNHARAQELAELLQRKYPQSNAGLTLQGDIAFRQKQYGRALDAYQRAQAVRADGTLTLKIAGHTRPTEPFCRSRVAPRGLGQTPPRRYAGAAGLWGPARGTGQPLGRDRAIRVPAEEAAAIGARAKQPRDAAVRAGSRSGAQAGADRLRTRAQRASCPRHIRLAAGPGKSGSRGPAPAGEGASRHAGTTHHPLPLRCCAGWNGKPATGKRRTREAAGRARRVSGTGRGRRPCCAASDRHAPLPLITGLRPGTRVVVAIVRLKTSRSVAGAWTNLVRAVVWRRTGHPHRHKTH